MIEPRFYRKPITGAVSECAEMHTLSSLLNVYQNGGVHQASERDLSELKALGFSSLVRDIVGTRSMHSYDDIQLICNRLLELTSIDSCKIEFVDDDNFSGLFIIASFKSLLPSISFQSTESGFFAASINYDFSQGNQRKLRH
ncbi:MULTISPECIES: hypothetical protein [Vibrio]|uniref:hypothetical protein n=1 Tax=Vibrio TaxID=662 RepID=UPI00104D5B77|nr:hypothetical protein [Vibrio crassostreae]TCT62819.1 hypothetical protein EDB31_13533 [Vibrio crassostreae]CAH6878574.1 conserved hypothetical protein [Vibrio chagasii]